MAHKTNLVPASISHPDFLLNSGDWAEWRETFNGGKDYRNKYLLQWSDRETDPEFQIRKSSTPIPTFAKAAITDIRNSIFQRLEDVARTNGSGTYNKASEGEGSGVDRKGTSMNSFVGVDILTELLVMGRVGVYVDAPNIRPTTLAQQSQLPNLSPYCYRYPIEDILSYRMDDAENPGTFSAVLLRDHVIHYNNEFAGVELPDGKTEHRIRLVWKDEITGKVKVRMWEDTPEKKVIMLDGADEDGAVTLDIDIVPFAMADIGESLMIDITSYQHALLNLASGDVNWSLMSSSPFLTIQRDLRSAGSHLKKPGGGNTPEPGGQRAQSSEEQIGGKGRYYDVDTDRPGYIAPPTDPLLASMKLQEKLEDDIRKLVNLAVSNKAGSRTESAEAKKLSSQGLEAGLSYIGLVLQDLENHIAKFWAAYEGEKPAKVAYPARYVLKQDIERIEEATKMIELMREVPSRTARKCIAKQIVNLMLGGKESSEELTKMLNEIKAANYTLASVEQVIQAHEQGLVGNKTASTSLGYDEKEAEVAVKDQAKRIELSMAAQTKPGDEAAPAPGARNKQLSGGNPAPGKDEKKEAQDGK